MAHLLQLQNFINGEYVAPSSGKYFVSDCPSTGKPHCRVPDSDAADVEHAVSAAKAAFPAWSAKTMQERSSILLKIADLIEHRLEEFARAEALDQGKTIATARTVDIPRSVKNFRFFATAILHHSEKAFHTDHEAVNYTYRVPVGVAGLISPWNLPLYLLSWKIAPAIAVGNCCVAKPSELTSVTAWMLGQVLNDAGVPPGVVNLVFGYGYSAGQALVAHPEVPLISFTGGTKTAEHIIKTSAPFYKKLSLELGGKNPNIIFEDADFRECITTSVRSSFSNQGEICLCGSRIFVQSTVYDKFVHEFVEAARKWKVGDPSDPSTMVGALISREHLAKVSGYVELAKQEGGTIALGGDPREHLPPQFQSGFFHCPTIITGLPFSARTCQEEIFGPVVTITPFTTEEEVIRFVNSVKYGLAASVWTSDVKRANRVAQKIDAGQVWVNCWMLRDLRVPFGGMKQSGYGREGGDYSIDFYTETKLICLKM